MVVVSLADILAYGSRFRLAKGDIDGRGDYVDVPFCHHDTLFQGLSNGARSQGRSQKKRGAGSHVEFVVFVGLEENKVI